MTSCSIGNIQGNKMFGSVAQHNCTTASEECNSHFYLIISNIAKFVEKSTHLARHSVSILRSNKYSASCAAGVRRSSLKCTILTHIGMCLSSLYIEPF
jgi:hypothetical protein